MIYDAAVIGTGAAGVSAALNLRIRGKDFIWIGSRELSAGLNRAERVRNYPGLPDVTGAELAGALKAHIAALGIGITEGVVNSVLPVDGAYALMAGSEFYEARTVLLATGAAVTAALEGESGLVGRGVSYCATCDGMLYRGRTVAVIVTSPRFEHEVVYLAGLAARVLLFARYPGCGIDLPNVELMSGVPAAVVGETRAEGVRCADGTVCAADGVFCLRESVALSTLLPGLAMEGGHIAVDRAQRTSLPGVFAAGDCTGRPYQYAKAVGEGNVAAHSILEYLAGQGG